jgi:NADPH-dependent glutamate synthase beta subunit-like oxidoreductase
MDVASTIKKAGVKEVSLLYRRSRKEMPADINEIAETEKDGVEIRELISPVAFSGQDYLVAIECQKMELGLPDHTGRSRPLPVKDSKFTMEVDLAVNAVGEKPTVDFLPELISINGDGTIATDPMNMETSMEGVFAGGDVVLGSATVSEAIVNAYRAAQGIEKYLQKS